MFNAVLQPQCGEAPQRWQLQLSHARMVRQLWHSEDQAKSPMRHLDIRVREAPQNCKSVAHVSKLQDKAEAEVISAGVELGH